MIHFGVKSLDLAFSDVPLWNHGQALRSEHEGAVYHITSRGNERRVFADQLGIATAHQQDENKLERNGKIREAVEQFHYSQQEVAKHTGLHYTTISWIMRETLNLKT